MANILDTIPRIVILTEMEERILLDDGPEILVYQNGDTEFEGVEVLDIRGEDRIDISAFDLDSEDIEQLISDAQPLENGGGVRIIGPFGQLQLLGITKGVLDQIGPDLFITNTAPIALDDIATTVQNSAVSINVLDANGVTINILNEAGEVIGSQDSDSDPNGDALSIAEFATTTAEGGNVSVDSNGLLIYTPGPGFTGTDSIRYTVTDGDLTATAVVTVTVNPNDLPIAVDDLVQTNEDIPVDIFVLDNDFDPNGDNISIVDFSETTAAGGIVSSVGGSLTYQPGFGFFGTDSFDYTISDGDLTDTATVTVTVREVNNAPIAEEDFAFTTEDIPVNIFVLDNDFDPDVGDVISIAGFEESTDEGGTVTVQGNSLLYQPGLGFAGTDSFSYTITDGDLTSTAVVRVTVAEDPPPIAGDDFAETSEDIPVNIFVLDNDFDLNGEALSIVGFAQTTATGGTISAADGSSLSYQPGLDFFGTDSFNYTISDGDATDTATVTVTVNPVNDPPIALDDFAETSGNIAVDIFVLDNDFDPENDPLSIVGFPQTTAAGGSISSTGSSLTYQPGLGFFGTDSFNYTISDGELTATATVTVQQDNQPPIAGDDFAFTTEDIPINIFVLDNDIDDDVVSISNFEETTTSGGQVSQDGNVLIYSPGFGFAGTDSFVYTIADSFGQTSSAIVTVTVGPNDPPEANPDAATTTQNSPVAIAVLSNDSDPDGDPISISNFAVFTAAGGSVSIDDNQLVYTPAAEFTGTDTFVYTITDSFGAIGSSTVTVTVAPDNTAPIAVDDEATTFEDIPVEIGVLDNDFDLDGDLVEILEFSSTSAAGGTVTYNANGTIDRNDDFLEYIPPAEFTGTDSFTYTIVDQQEATSAATVTVTVEPPPNPPVAEDDFAETLEDEPVSIDVLGNDTDVDGDPLEIADFPETTAGGGTVSFDNNGTPFNPEDDLLVYEPALGFTGTDSFIYTISDGLLTDTATVTVTTLNQPPIALDDFTETPENTNVTIAVLENDFDINGDLISVSGVSATAAGGTVSILDIFPDQLLYRPAEDFTGTDSFTYTITDGELTDTATVTVTVEEVNEEPVAENDEATTDEGTLVTIDVVDNDFDPDGDDLEILEWEQFTENRGLIVLQDNQLVYDPAPGFIGTDSFSYTISDGELTSTATVTVQVLEVNEEPVAVDDEATTVQGIEVGIEVLENDFDPDGDPLEILDFAETTESGGTLSININLTPFDPSDDLLVYEPAEEFTGTDSFTYTIADSSGATATATVEVTVAPNSGTIALDDFANTNVNVPVSIEVLVNDTDLDGDPISLDAFQATTTFGGIVNRNNNGTPGNRTDDFLTYTPAAGFVGQDSFSYTISDDLGVTDTAIVTVAVIEPNNAPSAVDDVAFTTEGLPTAIAVLNNDFDEDGNFLSIVNFSAFTSQGGNVTTDGLNLIYTSAVGFTGIDSFNYTISDGELTDTATVTVGVNMEPNEPPVAGDDTVVTTEGIFTSIAVLNNDFDPEGDPLFVIGISNTTTFGGTVALDGLDNVIYNPAFGFTGTDSFSYTIADTRSGIPDVGTVTITVEPDPNVPPVAVEDSQVTDENIPVAIDVLVNDFDTDINDFISIVGFAQTTVFGGTVSQQADGTLLYNPAFNFDGTDSFNYTIADSFGETASATVTVTVLDVNEAPIALDDFAVTTQNIQVNIAVLGNDTDPNDDAIAIAGFAQTSNFGGTVSEQADGTLLYNPAFDFTGTDSFNYTITDGPLTSTAIVSVTVEPPVPVAVLDEVASLAGETVSIPVLLNDSPDDGLVLVNVGTSANGVVQVNGDRAIYTPNAGFTGPDSFTYTIQDSLSRTSTATVNVNVVAVLDRSGADVIVGTEEGSQVVGTDIIRETLAGGAGNDTLIGNEGADVLSGGAGADVFAYLRLSDSGADPEDPLEPGDTIVDFELGVDSLLFNLEVAPGIQVSPTDVEINLGGISNGVAAIGLNTANTLPDFLPEQFVIVLTDLPTTTTEAEIRNSISFSGS